MATTQNNDGERYVITMDTAKEGAELWSLNDYFKARVGDNRTPLYFRWYTMGLLNQFTGTQKPRIHGKVGNFTIDDTKSGVDQIEMAPDAVSVTWTGSTSDMMAGGLARYELPEQLFPKSGIFKGFIGYVDDANGEQRLSGVNVWFKVLDGFGDLGKDTGPYIAELEKILTNADEAMRQKGVDFDTKTNQALADLKDKYDQDIAASHEASVKATSALNSLSATAGSIDSQIKAMNIVTKDEFNSKSDALTKSIGERLAKIHSAPVTVASESELKSKYPSGPADGEGVFVTLDTWHQWAWLNNQWTDGGSYNSPALTNDQKEVLSKALMGYKSVNSEDDTWAMDLNSLPANTSIVYWYHDTKPLNFPPKMTGDIHQVISYSYHGRDESVAVNTYQVLITTAGETWSRFNIGKWSDWKIAVQQTAPIEKSKDYIVKEIDDPGVKQDIYGNYWQIGTDGNPQIVGRSLKYLPTSNLNLGLMSKDLINAYSGEFIKINWILGKGIDFYGTEIASNNIRHSDYISVTPGDTYAYTSNCYFNAVSLILFDINKKVVDFYPKDSGLSGVMYSGAITIPRDVRFVVINTTDYNGSYEASLVKINKIKAKVETNDFATESWEPLKLGVPEKYRYTTDIKVIYNSIKIDNENIATFDPIPCSPGEKIKVTGRSYYQAKLIVFFDSFGKLITSYPKTQDNGLYREIIVTAPANAAYMVCNQFADDTKLYKATAPKVEVIGDSWIADNTIGDHGANWVRMIADAADLNIINSGIGGTGFVAGNGDKKQQYVNRSLSTSADLTLLFGSFNDMYVDWDSNQLNQAMLDTINHIYSLNLSARIIMATPCPWGTINPLADNDRSKKADTYVQLMIDFARKYGFPILDLYHESNLRPWDQDFIRTYYHGMNETDTTHLNTDGNRIIFPKILNFIKNNL